MSMDFKPHALRLLTALTASLLLTTACSYYAYRTEVVSTHTVTPADEPFAWANDTLQTVGTGSSTPNLSEPRRSLVAKQSAKTAALAALKQQITLLPIDEQRTLRTVMEENLGIHHAVERYLQSAQVISEQETTPGVYEVRVSLSLAAVAQILKQYHIGLGEEEPAPPSFDSDLPPVS